MAAKQKKGKKNVVSAETITTREIGISGQFKTEIDEPNLFRFVTPKTKHEKTPCTAAKGAQKDRAIENLKAGAYRKVELLFHDGKPVVRLCTHPYLTGSRDRKTKAQPGRGYLVPVRSSKEARAVGAAYIRCKDDTETCAVTLASGEGRTATLGNLRAARTKRATHRRRRTRR